MITKWIKSIFIITLIAITTMGCKNAEIDIEHSTPIDSTNSEYAEDLVIIDGQAQPMLEYADYHSEGYTNSCSDILRFTVYVETDNDTDNDGMADLVKVFTRIS